MSEMTDPIGSDSGGTSSPPREGGMHSGLNPLVAPRSLGKVALRQIDPNFQGDYHGKSRDFHGRTPLAPKIPPPTAAELARLQRQEHFKESFFRLTNLYQLMSEFSVAHHQFRSTTRDLWLRELDLAIQGMKVFLPRERKVNGNSDSEGSESGENVGETHAEDTGDGNSM